MARILIVDDDPDFLALAARVLGTRHETETALGSLAAMERVLERPYDVIVSDVHMPGMSGFLLAERVQRANHVPVVFTSSRDHRGEVLLRGGAGFLPKPVTPARLCDEVAQVMAMAAPCPRKVLLVEDDDVLLTLFTAALEDFDVVAARSVPQALAKIEALGEKIALVLTDHVPARVDALALIRSVRATPAVAAVPVVVHTAAEDALREALRRELGVERVIEKTAFLRFLLTTGEMRRRALS